MKKRISWIIWKGGKWIVDYKTHTIYQLATILEDDPTRFTIHARIGNVPFLVFNGSIYFKNGEKEFYKVINSNAVLISKEEYYEIEKKRLLNIRYSADVDFVSELVGLNIIDEVVYNNSGLRVSSSFDPRSFGSFFFDRFSKQLKTRIRDFSKRLIHYYLPYVNKGNGKNEVKVAIDMLEDSDFQNLVDMAYENNKEAFDLFCERIIEIKEKKRTPKV